jgi:hypothetical protein
MSLSFSIRCRRRDPARTGLHNGCMYANFSYHEKNPLDCIDSPSHFSEIGDFNDGLVVMLKLSEHGNFIWVKVQAWCYEQLQNRDDAILN